MPFGIPRTDAERQQRHKRIYGNTNIPAKRRGMSATIRKLYQRAGEKAPNGKGEHTLRAHKCVVNYLKRGLAKDEAWKRCMGGLGRNLAVKKAHWA